jgi:hypothetical protein
MRLATVQGCLGDNANFAALSALVQTVGTTFPTLGIEEGYTPFLCQANIADALSTNNLYVLGTPGTAQTFGAAPTFTAAGTAVATVPGTGRGTFPDANPAWGEINEAGAPKTGWWPAVGSATNPFPLTTPTFPTTAASPAAGTVTQAPQAGPWNRLFIERRLRTKCCGWRDNYNTDPVYTQSNGNSIFLARRFGVCINPLLESCCTKFSEGTGYTPAYFGAIGGLGKPYSRFREKCCYGGTFNARNQLGNWTSGTTYTATTADARYTNPGAVLAPTPPLISYLDDFCPCKASLVNDMCNSQIPATSPTYACCTKTKYPEIALVNPWGKCYNQMTMQCCNTGDLYDPGSKQCCSINGVQSVNVPCPCGADGDCGTNLKCCQQLFPTPTDPTGLCNMYVNYPSGTGPYEAQPCLGQCINTNFQICCNGMACIDQFELCCNNTCCNKFSERCTLGIRAGSRGSFSNRIDFRVPYEVCTQIEGMTPFRATLAFLLPLFLLAATFIAFFATLNFAKRQNSLQPLSYYEMIIVAISALSILLAWPLYFSSTYKYGIVWIWSMFFVMLAALSQQRALNIASIVVLGLLIIYVVDPFYGNEFLTLASDRTPPPASGIHGYTGVIGSLVMNVAGDYGACTNWYDYFRRDPLVEDPRLLNPANGLLIDTPFLGLSHHTYGFCARGWLVALCVFTGLDIIVTYFLFFMALVTHIRNILFEKAQKTDDVVRQPWY